MIKNNKKTLILTSVLILLPILAGLLLWNQLPEQIPTHWNSSGQVDQYSPRWVAVFVIPLILLAVHLLCIFVTKSDKGNKNQTQKIMILTFWLCPVISILGTGSIYLTVLGYELNMVQLPCILVGIMFVIIGNYLPKCKHNYTIGIKIPWTLASEENWNATHRFAGKVWMIGGFVFLLLAFLPSEFLIYGLIAAIMLLVLLPTVYSYRYMKTHG